jgi:AraC family transcriptional regulator, transcriptional activator of the genes for pyochelin and ferripyochelin receptors
MHYSNKCITINHPNLLVPSSGSVVPFGYFIESGNEKEESDLQNTVQIKDLFLPSFSVRISEGELSQDAMLINTSAEGLDLLGSCLFLKGNITSSAGQSELGITSFHGSQNFKYDPNNLFVHYVPSHSPFHIVHFSIQPNRLFEYLPESEWWSDELRRKISNNESFMGERYTPITLLQERALQNIFDCPLTGQLGLMMIETSIVQIMLIQLHALFQEKNLYSVKLAQRDMDVAQGVKELLAKTFLEDHSLESLALHFGVNINKLMTLFKKVFSKSIFEYLSELRMDYARELLLEKDHLITEVARTLGYKNPNHFSAAFKRKFGFPPSQLR